MCAQSAKDVPQPDRVEGLLRRLPPYDSCFITEHSNSGSVRGLFQPTLSTTFPWNETKTPGALTA